MTIREEVLRKLRHSPHRTGTCLLIVGGAESTCILALPRRVTCNVRRCSEGYLLRTHQELRRDPGGCLLAATGRGQHLGNQHGRVPGRRGSRERGQEPPISKVSRPLSRKLFGCLEPGPWPNILMIALIHSEFIAVCSHGRVMIRTEDGSGTLIALRWFLPARAR